MKKVLSFFATLLAIAGIGTLLSSCGKQKDVEGEHRTHVAVQLEDYGPWSIVDANGQIVARDAYPREAMISDVYDGVYWVKYDEGVFVLYNVNEPDKPLCDTCIAATEFATGRAIVSMKGKPLQVIDTKGQVVATLPESYVKVSAFNNEGVARYLTDFADINGTLDRDGKEIYEETLFNILPNSLGDGAMILSNGDIVDYDGDELGYIDTDDYKIEYESEARFSDGLLGLIKREDIGVNVAYIDKKGNEQFTVEGFSPTVFHDGYAVYNTVNGAKVIDKQGNVLIETHDVHDQIIYLSQGKFLKYEDENCSIIDNQGNELCKLDDVRDVYNATLLGGDRFLLYGGGYRIYDMQGKRIGDTPFAKISESPCYKTIDYINPDDLASYVSAELSSISIAVDVDSLMKKADMNMKTATNRNGISIKSKKFGMPLSIGYSYNGKIAQSLTHKERRGGYIYTVTDGYSLTGALLKSFTLSFELGDVDHPCTVDGYGLVNAIKQKLKDTGYEELDNGIFYTEGADPINSYGKLLKGVTVDVSRPNRVTYLTIKCRIAFE